LKVKEFGEAGDDGEGDAGAAAAGRPIGGRRGVGNLVKG